MGVVKTVTALPIGISTGFQGESIKKGTTKPKSKT